MTTVDAQQRSQIVKPGAVAPNLDVAPGHAIFFEAINSAPFARPPLDELTAALGFVAENDFTARGEA